MTIEVSIYAVCGTFCRLLWVAINRGVVPGAGIEPARYFYRGILSPLCLPISPPGLSVYGVCRASFGIIRDHKYLNRTVKGTKNSIIQSHMCSAKPERIIANKAQDDHKLVITLYSIQWMGSLLALYIL